MRPVFYSRRRPPEGPLASDLPVPPRTAGCGWLRNVSTMAGYTTGWDVGTRVGSWHAHYCPGARLRWRWYVGPLGLGHWSRRVRQVVFRVSLDTQPGDYTRMPNVFIEPETAALSVQVISIPPTVFGEAANVTAVVRSLGLGYRLFGSRGRTVRVPTTLSWP